MINWYIQCIIIVYHWSTKFVSKFCIIWCIVHSTASYSTCWICFLHHIMIQMIHVFQMCDVSRTQCIYIFWRVWQTYGTIWMTTRLEATRRQYLKVASLLASLWYALVCNINVLGQVFDTPGACCTKYVTSRRANFSLWRARLLQHRYRPYGSWQFTSLAFVWLVSTRVSKWQTNWRTGSFASASSSIDEAW